MNFIKIHTALICFFTSVVLTFCVNARAYELDISGQLSGWTKETEIADNWENSTGVRYIPEADIAYYPDQDSSLDAEMSLNCYAISGSGPFEDDSSIKLYRANLRYATIQTETQLGLQKINFGPARVLRSLRWFDRLDPTDPLQFTEGVRALRFRYDALNNANVWLWGLYDNHDPKGYEILPTSPHTLEPGGRFQFPLFNADVGFTFHSRKVDSSSLFIPEYRENRYALDGRWDVGIGIWFEAMLQQGKTSLLPFEYTKRATLGLDYTFDIGSGLYLLLEHMSTDISNRSIGWNDDSNISAVYMSYPIGLLDNIKAVGYYYWDYDKYSQFIEWTRTYDRIAISFSLTYVPKIQASGMGSARNATPRSRGGQVLIIFNH